jgi:hypothetical protein
MVYYVNILYKGYVFIAELNMKIMENKCIITDYSIIQPEISKDNDNIKSSC